MIRATVMMIGLAVAASHAAAAESAIINRLRAALPSVSSVDPTIKSIHVRAASVDPSRAFVIEAWYRAPAAYAVRFYDGTDGTPLVAIVNGRGAIVYNALDQYVLLVADAGPEFSLRSDGHDLKMGIGINLPLAAGAKLKSPKVEVDLRSFFPADGGITKAEDLGGGKSRLTHTSDKGNRMSAVIAGGSVSGVSLTDKDGNPQFRVDAIEIDRPIPDAPFSLPTRQALAAQLKVADAGPGITTAGGLVKTLMKDIAVRAGARNPGLRERLKLVLPANTDWARVAADDAKASAILRDLLRTPGQQPPPPNP